MTVFNLSSATGLSFMTNTSRQKPSQPTSFSSCPFSPPLFLSLYSLHSYPLGYPFLSILPFRFSPPLPLSPFISPSPPLPLLPSLSLSLSSSYPLSPYPPLSLHSNPPSLQSPLRNTGEALRYRPHVPASVAGLSGHVTTPLAL